MCLDDLGIKIVFLTAYLLVVLVCPTAYIVSSIIEYTKSIFEVIIYSKFIF